MEIECAFTSMNVSHKRKRTPDTIVANRPWTRSQRSRLNTPHTATWNVLPRELQRTVLCYVLDDPALTEAIVLEQYEFLYSTPCLRTADILAALCQLLNAKSHSMSPDVLLGHLRLLQKNAHNPSALLLDAALAGYGTIVSWCIVHTNPPISVSTKTDALRWASTSGHAAVVELLLKAGANVHAWDDESLRWASENGHATVVELLLKSGANVHALDDRALRWASQHGHATVVELLLQAGANVHACDDESLRWASENGHATVVELLLKSGANVSAWDDEALRYASENGHLAVVELLLQAGANVRASDDEALRLASENGHAAVVKLLRYWGDVHHSIYPLLIGE